jgi:hypothetical protein
LAVPAALLHLVAATDAERMVHHQSIPLSNTLLVVETITAAIFGFTIDALAVVGALTRTLGNWIAAALGVVGGIGYGLADGTAAFTRIFDPLFPTAIGIALWAIVVAIGLLVRRSRPIAMSGPGPHE